MPTPDTTPPDPGDGDPMAAELLEAGCHDHYVDAALYDYEYRRRRADVTFYRRLAGRVLGGPGDILELACGSGRVTAALARDGHRVVALDLSATMLERAAARISRLGKAARSRVHLVRGDARAFSLAGKFPLVIMAFNSFEHLLTRTEVAACTDAVKRHLSPGGRFAFDVQNPCLPWLIRDPERRWARTRFRHPETGEPLIYTTNHDYDPVSQIALIRIFYDPHIERRTVRSRTPVPDERVVYLTQRKFFPAELETLMWATGFSVEQCDGDFHGEPLSADAESQVLVVRPR
ncbi:MAG TPA: class I SAM-dependent methyltransferase [Kofleriaceae bacterium]|nr:class I SAM-dependent methyltransferase [Kofleriaceae bacterium]